MRLCCNIRLPKNCKYNFYNNCFYRYYLLIYIISILEITTIVKYFVSSTVYYICIMSIIVKNCKLKLSNVVIVTIYIILYYLHCKDEIIIINYNYHYIIIIK